MLRPLFRALGGDDPAEADLRRAAWAVVLAVTLLRLLIAWVQPLGADEAYAVAVAREGSLSFFDHPPLSFWLPVALARLTGIEHPFVYRLPFLVTGTAALVLMRAIGTRLGGPVVGLWALLLFGLAPFFLVSGGAQVVPDGTLVLGLALAVRGLLGCIEQTRAPIRDWLVVGLGLAVAMLSKYQAAWLPVAVALFMLLHPAGRRWWVQPGPWIAAALGALGMVPAILWNAQNGWASFAYQGGRAGGGFYPLTFLQMLAGQALFLLPTGLWAGLAGLWRGLRPPGRSAQTLLLALVALGPIVIFQWVYLRSPFGLPHWPMPGWQFALPLGALWLAARPAPARRRFLRWALGWFGVIALALGLFVFQARTGLLTRPFFATPPAWDDTSALFDYRGLKGALKARGLWDETDLVLSTNWVPAGLLDTALGGEKPMRVPAGRGAHHFAWLADARATGRGLMMLPVRLGREADAAARLLAAARKLDPEAEPLPPVILNRGAQPYVAVLLVRLTVTD